MGQNSSKESIESEKTTKTKKASLRSSEKTTKIDKTPSLTPEKQTTRPFTRLNETITRRVKNGFKTYTFEKGKSIWHGTTANFSTDSEIQKWYQKILNNDIANALNKPFYLTDKKTASAYGTAMDSSKLVCIYTKPPDPKTYDINSSDIIPLYYKPGHHGVNIEFEVIKDFVLLDIGNIGNIKKLWDIIDKSTKIDNDTKEGYHATIAETCAMPRTYKVPIGKRSFYTKYRKPKRCERKSNDFQDEQLIKLICNNSELDFIDGWIYFGTEHFGKDPSTFHGEVLLCKPEDKLQFKSVYEVPDTSYDFPSYDEFKAKSKKYIKEYDKYSNIFVQSKFPTNVIFK
jgi:hypothetical protein